MTTRTTPARQLVAITPSDSTSYADNPFRGFHVNVGGTIFVDSTDVGTNVELEIVAGQFYPYEITKFYSTGRVNAEVVGLR